MCNNIIVLYIFLILKILIYFIVPILLIFLRKRKIFNIVLYIELIILILFLTANIFNKNACLVNSLPPRIKETKEFNTKQLNKSLHNTNNDYSIKITPNKKYKTFTGRSLYYYNQNKDYMNNVYYKCNDTKIYLNSVGSSITSFSTAISTLYDKAISPVEIFNYYKDSNLNICDSEITLEKVYNSTMKVYGGITLAKINKYEVESSLKNDGLVIVELKSNENSKLTCDSNYIIIYNKGLDGKYMISDPALPSKPYACSYSSKSFGNVISNENMNKTFSLDEINNEAINYYLVKRG